MFARLWAHVIARELSMSAFALPLIAERCDVASDFTAGVLLFYLIPLAGLSIPAGMSYHQRERRKSGFATESANDPVRQVSTRLVPR